MIYDPIQRHLPQTPEAIARRRRLAAQGLTISGYGSAGSTADYMATPSASTRQ